MRRTLICLILPLLVGLPETPAFGAAWPMPQGGTKLLINRLHETAPNFITHLGAVERLGEARKELSKAHIEYGLSDAITLEAIAEHSQDHIANDKNSATLLRFGGRIRARHLETGLLPPYLFKGLQKIFPKAHSERQKRASLSFGLVGRQTDFNNRRDMNHGHHWQIALADKVSLGPVFFLQSVENGETHMSGLDWTHSQYRFEIDWRHYFAIGTQVQFFDDENTGFAALTHLQTASWSWPRKQIKLKWSYGSKRQSGFIKSDVMALELEVKF